MQQAPLQLKQIVTWELRKYEGEAPRPGEHKEPIEIITGGDNLPTLVSKPQGVQNAAD